MNNKIIIGAMVVIVAAGSFFGGMKYQQKKASAAPLTAQSFQNLSADQRRQLFANGGGRGGQGPRGGQFGGAVIGSVISKDDKSITVKMQDGSTKIVFLSDSTQTRKTTQASSTDVQVGTNVLVNGQTNQDGSVTAQNIQIR